MELHQLRYFLAVARTKSFSRAAEQCHVAQPSLSQQIMKLEGELEEKLFERTKRSVALTAVGEIFQAHAERVLEEVDLARDKVRDVRGLLHGRVTLGALPTVAPYFLPERLKAFALAFPGIEVQVHEDTTALLSAAVLNKEIDVALISLPVEHKALVSEAFFEEDLLIALPAKHPLVAKKHLTLDDLEAETFILMKEGHCLAGQALQFCRMNNFSPRLSFRSAQIETVIAFVAAGWGVSVVPAMARKVDPKSVRYLPIAGMKRSIGIIRHRERPFSRAARVLVDFMRQSPPSGV